MTTRKKLIIYKVAVAVFAFIVAFMPSTVSRSREVNSRVVVELIGIDGGDKVSVTAQYVMPTETQGSTSKDVVTVSGNTVTEAVEALSTALGRRAELGHCSMIVVGDKATPQQLATLMTATDITADVHLTAAEGEASELVGDLTEFMKKTGATDADFIAYGVKKAHIATNTLLDFLCDIGSASHSSFVPLVQMIEDDKQSGGGSQSGSGGGSSSDGGSEGSEGQQSGSGESKDGGGSKSGGGQKTGMKVNKLALYKPEGRCGVIEEESARGVAWVSAATENGVLTADVELPDKTIKNVSARLLKKCVDIKTDADSDAITVNIHAVIEPRGDKFNEVDALDSEQASRALKAGFADSIKSELEAALADCVKYDCDVLFIGKEFYRHATDYFDSEYALENIQVNFGVEITVK